MYPTGRLAGSPFLHIAAQTKSSTTRWSKPTSCHLLPPPQYKWESHPLTITHNAANPPYSTHLDLLNFHISELMGLKFMMMLFFLTTSCVVNSATAVGNRALLSPPDHVGVFAPNRPPSNVYTDTGYHDTAALLSPPERRGLFAPDRPPSNVYTGAGYHAAVKPSMPECPPGTS